MSPGLASVIIPCWNQLEFTRQCIAALMRHTRAAWELILIDNGSTDGTKDYLAGVRMRRPSRSRSSRTPRTEVSRPRSTRACSARAGNTSSCSITMSS